LFYLDIREKIFSFQYFGLNIKGNFSLRKAEMNKINSFSVLKNISIIIAEGTNNAEQFCTFPLGKVATNTTQATPL
jgi:hypothetical protein